MYNNMFLEDLGFVSRELTKIISNLENTSALTDVPQAMLAERIVIAQGLIDSVRTAIKESEEGVEL